MDVTFLAALLFLLPVSVNSSELESNAFRWVKGADNVQGVVSAEFTVKSLIKCSASCLNDVLCRAYQYKKQRENNCVIIHDNNDNNDNSTGGQTFNSSGGSVVYKMKVCPRINPCQNNGTCVNGADGYRCECPAGYIGSTCAEVDDCPVVNPCWFGKICVDGPGSFTCECPTNFAGPKCRLNCTNSWCTQVRWPQGDSPGILFKFDGYAGITTHGLSAPEFTVGKVGKAMYLNGTLSQWVDLGDISGYSCFSLPNTCGPPNGRMHDGASLTAWINLIDCPPRSGFITSKEAGTKTGFYTNCTDTGVDYWLLTSYTRYVVRVHTKPSGWFHLTITFYKLDTYHMSVYYDGDLKDFTSFPSDFIGRREAGSGKMAIGKLEYDSNRKYATVMIDELTLWNNKEPFVRPSI